MSYILPHHLSLRPLAEGARNIVQDDRGVVCMLVVDPETRKLRIPLNYVYPTLAQQRTTTPSLCQLFLNGRCRQGDRCHQVHAVLDVVVALRSRVEHLPVCCAAHGDFDYLNALDDQSWTSRVLLHVPDALYGGGYIPLSFFSYTIPIGRLLREAGARLEQGGDVGPRGCVTLNACDFKMCGLHLLDRCRYAEECIFLHVCKEVAAAGSCGDDGSSLIPRLGSGSGPDVQYAKKNSVFVSVSRQQRVRGSLRYHTPDEYSVAFPPRGRDRVVNYRNASDINSDSSWASGQYVTEPYVENGVNVGPLPSLVPRLAQRRLGVPRCCSSATASTTTTAAAREEASVCGAGGYWGCSSLPEGGCESYACDGSWNGCRYANCGSHADCNSYVYSNQESYRSEGYNQCFDQVGESSAARSTVKQVSGSVAVRQPERSLSSASVSARGWQHNPYGLAPGVGVSG